MISTLPPFVLGEADQLRPLALKLINCTLNVVPYIRTDTMIMIFGQAIIFKFGVIQVQVQIRDVTHHL